MKNRLALHTSPRNLPRLPYCYRSSLVSLALSFTGCEKGETPGNESAAGKDSTSSADGDTAAQNAGDRKTAAADTAANEKPAEKKRGRCRWTPRPQSAAISSSPSRPKGPSDPSDSAEIKVEISGRIASIAAKKGPGACKGSLDPSSRFARVRGRRGRGKVALPPGAERPRRRGRYGRGRPAIVGAPAEDPRAREARKARLHYAGRATRAGDHPRRARSARRRVPHGHGR